MIRLLGDKAKVTLADAMALQNDDNSENARKLAALLAPLSSDDPVTAEGLKLINNLLMQGYRDLFLDYGPPLPAEGRDVIPAVRGADICHPGFDDPTTLGVCERPIALDIIVYVF